jgi:hypothetical protein
MGGLGAIGCCGGMSNSNGLGHYAGSNNNDWIHGVPIGFGMTTTIGGSNRLTGQMYGDRQNHHVDTRFGAHGIADNNITNLSGAFNRLSTGFPSY